MRSICAAVLLLTGAGAPAVEPLLWFDGGGQPLPSARQATALLVDARSHGLDPSDYQAVSLVQSVNAAGRERADPAALSSLDRRLTSAVTRYLADLHHGRVEPAALPRGYGPARRSAFDAEASLRRALASGRLDEAVRDAAPRIAQYERLREALAQYRALAVHRAWSSPLPALPSAGAGPPKLEPGQPYAGAPMLRERLVALGDLPPSTPVDLVYDGALADGVRAFQQRHGLAVDGVIGRGTMAAMEVTPAARARQLELMLERLRWTPLLQGPRMVVVNIPEFTLRAYEVEGERIVLRSTMKIIVGKAMRTQTPLFVGQMRHVEFQPFWNVPPSIARGEVVPRLRRDPDYWDREGFEFVAGGQVVTTLSPALLDETVAGRARIRQRPGPRNALGDIKFVFPNEDNIYLHHTPSVSLFARDRRDFSHGCIRVEDPVALAAFVLQGLPEWTGERILQAMTEDDPRTVRLAEPLTVVIAYGTAMVKSGRVHFYEDIYGHDRWLDNALRASRPAWQAPQ